MSEDGKYRFRLTQQLIDKLLMVFFIFCERYDSNNSKFRKKFLILLIFYHQNQIEMLLKNMKKRKLIIRILPHQHK